jgi:hypothetical protein
MLSGASPAQVVWHDVVVLGAPLHGDAASARPPANADQPANEKSKKASDREHDDDEQDWLLSARELVQGERQEAHEPGRTQDDFDGRTRAEYFVSEIAARSIDQARKRLGPQLFVKNRPQLGVNGASTLLLQSLALTPMQAV